MTMFFAAATAALATVCAVAHSMLSESRYLKPLLSDPQITFFKSRRARDVTRLMFHLPSFVWFVLGIMVLVARMSGGDRLLSIAAALIFLGSGLTNLFAIRRVHFGGLLLLTAAALAAADAGLLHFGR